VKKRFSMGPQLNAPRRCTLFCHLGITFDGCPKMALCARMSMNEYILSVIWAILMQPLRQTKSSDFALLSHETTLHHEQGCRRLDRCQPGSRWDPTRGARHVRNSAIWRLCTTHIAVISFSHFQDITNETLAMWANSSAIRQSGMASRVAGATERHGDSATGRFNTTYEWKIQNTTCTTLRIQSY